WQAQTSDFSVVGHQVYTHLRNDFGPLLFADLLQILKVAFSMGGNEGMRFKPNIPRYMAPSIVSSMQWSRPVPLAEKQPQSIMFPPPCLTVGMVFLGPYSAFFPLQTRQIELMPKSLIDLTTSCLPILLRKIQVFIGKLQTALYICFLEQGDLASAAVPLRRSVLPMVFLVTVVPAALRSFPSSPCVVLGLFCTFRMIIDT